MLDFLFNYEMLRITWWVLLGVLLIGFAVTDGFDMGVGALLPFVAKTDIERRVAINTIGPVWEGNQVWFVLGGGAIFAAWPALYALSFSGFYLAMFLVLFAMILRPVAFKYRSKREDARWRSNWDWALFIGGAVPALIFGVAVGNVLRGVPFHFNTDLRPFYEGTLFGLLNPVALYCGLVSLSMLVMHGGAWLAFKAEGPVADRARIIGGKAALAAAVLFAGGGVLVWLGLLGGYEVTSAIVWDGPSNPLGKTVITNSSGWLRNFYATPALCLVPALGIVAPLIAAAGFRARREGLTFLASKLGIFCIIATVGLAMFPILLPSSTNPGHSLAVFDASSSRATLRNMLIATVIFLPLILAYTAWVYSVLWGKVSEASVREAGTSAY
ncbi:MULTISPECIES: cytochrome d ubiquinol oxidase subunit II [unclassified Mesorhizobium]|uniref:cytochrome d ubiquinol oxidase subunit II n=1 Tax=unclassified Mesorhizobium TaxID=325217 RepID=UPI001128F2B9|nr:MULTISPECIES: cytochrome d ubiquinol oxidase subunit II [unclassified Mesorhizobium]MBZ9700886.1 cytochrome d ubiquinol oxidase subunit II [Mesorhizobium sp. CO1-1-3]MBZ9946822.1 cytochrome d ubiquinol oxidase subunit II [Mesorhizobium sp. BR1-1-11]TPJ04776.1 cytochrome d ubiquinol oxidase subunit II [Mesorhizobium sp. B2-8-1]TPM89950.1 cytochrome d ubiquinol oxidase subunit II [Mesorhizobium sp. B2-1-5]TPN31855.1 cytochrome d ubiquinol oxidase subunit II [Mesorhizobium sp. B1-1-6]